MEKRKSFFAGMLTMLLIVSLVGTAFASNGAVQKDLYYNGITVTLDGKKLDLHGDREPFIINGTTFLPVRAVSEALGLNVDWDGNTNTVVLESASSISKKESVYDDLRNWIIKNDNAPSDKYYSYLTGSQSNAFIISCNKENDGNIFVYNSSTSSSNTKTTLLITISKEIVIPASFEFYTVSTNSKPTMSCSNVFANKEVCATMNYEIKSGTISDELKDVYGQMAKISLFELLDFVNYVFTDQMHSDYSVADLGFVNYNQAEALETMK